MDTPTLKSQRRIKRGRWDNSREGIRRRKAAADAKREALAASLPPIPPDPEPLSVWQTVLVLDAHGEVMHRVVLHVPIPGHRCDQHAAEVDGVRQLLTATAVGQRVASMIAKRPSVALQADLRREAFLGADTGAACENAASISPAY